MMGKHDCTLSDDELITRCEEWVETLCRKGGAAWHTSYPCVPNRDPDILFGELAKRYRERIER